MEAIGLIGAAAIGAGASMYSASQANKMSRDIAREQMDFQERMSNTAYQRAVKDMRKAGINPMFLANGAGSASTPTGASASVHQADIGQNITNALTAYMDYKIKKSNDKLIQAQIQETKKITEKTEAEIEEIKQNTNINKPKEEVNNSVTQWIKKAKENLKKSDDEILNEQVKKLGVSEKGFKKFKSLPLDEKIRVYKSLKRNNENIKNNKNLKKSDDEILNEQVKKLGVSEKGFKKFKSLPLDEKIRVYKSLRKSKNK